MKIALVHDYLIQRGGAERVFELLCKLYDPTRMRDLDWGDRPIRTTHLQNIPGASKYFRLLAPLYFQAFRSLDLQEYDLIISSTSSFAKAVQKNPQAHHICFCHNVTRFLWDTKTYLKEYKKYRKLYPLLEKVFQYMRNVDLHYAQEPDLYIANSTIVAERIQRIYGKPATPINYPININKFIFSDKKDDFHLVSSRLLSYKRVDAIVEAFNWLGLPLLIMGEGPEREQLEARALKNIQFLGHVTDRERTYLMSKASCVIVAALEDYGLVPIEANASGTPVISFGAGGVLDTQVPGLTGLFFNTQAPEAIQAAVQAAQKIQWNYNNIREHVINHFTEEIFFKKVDAAIDQLLSKNKVSR
jgi:glycosyltransferase involved in cell wall biosynthesis